MIHELQSDPDMKRFVPDHMINTFRTILFLDDQLDWMTLVVPLASWLELDFLVALLLTIPTVRECYRRKDCVLANNVPDARRHPKPGIDPFQATTAVLFIQLPNAEHEPRKERELYYGSENAEDHVPDRG